MAWRKRIAIGVTLTAATAAIVSVVHCGFFAGQAPALLTGGAPQLGAIDVPEGFSVGLWAGDVPGARSMTLGPDGIVFVGSRDAGKVYAVVDGGDGKAERTVTIASGLDSPNGVAFRDGDLYVAEISRIIRFDEVAGRLDAPPEPVVVNDSFPEEPQHGWKFIAFGPDGWLYVPVGAPCNVCERQDERFSSITRMRPDGSALEVYAHGIRNTVGFDFHPRTGVLWFTDNGRDWMGDSRPPDELNRAPEPGMHFGFPYCHGRDLPDPEHHGMSCEQTTPPEAELGPHVAALGMRFYEGDRFPASYRGGIFIAEHGSWNRTIPIGYRVMFVPVNDGEAGEPRVFAEGWLQDALAWGRPVDVLELPDGSLLVSDDKAGMIYRIDYAAAADAG